MIEKKELISAISQKTEKIQHYITIFSKENQEEFFFLKEILFNLKSFIFEIKKDLEDDTIPTEFYNKILSILSEIYLEEHTTSIETSWEAFKIKLLDSNIIKRMKSVNFVYNFYKSLNFISDNIVVVGANGSGKSTLASNIKYNFNEKIGIVIPAQKLLIIPTFESIPNLEKSMSEYRSFEGNIIDSKITYNLSYQDTLPYEEARKYGADYKYILNTLFSEKTYVDSIVCRKLKEQGNLKKEDYPLIKLDKAIEIWNFLIEHREMFYDDNNNLKIRVKENSEGYPAYQMSDGEKNIFFLIGRVLLASDNAMIIIDEPEMYLHKAIVNKLWDKLEIERKDCKFIYLTHDLEFASSRKANKYWIKDFRFPNIWEIDPIPENAIPDSLLMKILGSRKKVLFCEGKKSSLDIQIYEILFPNYTIVPLESCSNVINYTRAFNKIPNKNTEAIGIVDRDFRTEAQISKFESEKIYVYSVAEIENLFLLEDFVKIFSEKKNEIINIEDLKEKALDKLEKDKEQQISNYVTSYINYVFSEEHMKNAKNKQELEANFNNFTTKIGIEAIYNKRKEEIDKIISERDYSKAMKVYNNKGLLNIVENLLGYQSNTYRFKALDILRKEEKVQQVLRDVFPQEITN